jgi:hypothetical protein
VILGSEKRHPLVDDDIPLPSGLPAAALKWAQGDRCRYGLADYLAPEFARYLAPSLVLAYLGRYTHRVTISNCRLIVLVDGQVSFRWRLPGASIPGR